ncbi:MAG TPA: DUF3267 domain-containing protein [Chloroflexi bacterium]|jgi:hypothetical protein|nr:DUF3267 domain-containing protein [Chloroflexota bacterium]
MTTGRIDRSVSVVTASALSLVVVAPLIIPLLAAYLLRWNQFTFSLNGRTMLIGLFILVAGVLVHEGLHALGWMIFGRVPASDIHIGMQWKWLTPYAHLRRPLAAGPYRAGALLPCLVLGVLPGVIAVLNGSPAWLAFALVFILGAGGDLLILWMIRDLPAGTLVEDHPTRAGCYVLTDTLPGGERA